MDYPGTTYTQAYGISGNNIAGKYSGGGFLYDGTTWTTLNYPGTYTGISGGKIVGYYPDNGTYHGFQLTLPEPTTLALLALGGLILTRRHYRHQ